MQTQPQTHAKPDYLIFQVGFAILFVLSSALMFHSVVLGHS